MIYLQTTSTNLEQTGVFNQRPDHHDVEMFTYFYFIEIYTNQTK